MPPAFCLLLFSPKQTCQHLSSSHTDIPVLVGCDDVFFFSFSQPLTQEWVTKSCNTCSSLAGTPAASMVSSCQRWYHAGRRGKNLCMPRSRVWH
ncbi:hypothetical protein K504DRAFT_93863 [Pleomassaria siparia CBS 279.74]|uniref:Uncharacterized protein n=1 Tax=Pleomassaria siparia CBS 279.74 TaxID=1314801 RepID=A0A6G1JYE2_9PLEO|nr:hypothetical protein K504DRAFT_93863 [Pleomassaria siparia CBS 279.74]